MRIVLQIRQLVIREMTEIIPGTQSDPLVDEERDLEQHAVPHLGGAVAADPQHTVLRGHVPAPAVPPAS